MVKKNIKMMKEWQLFLNGTKSKYQAQYELMVVHYSTNSQLLHEKLSYHYLSYSDRNNFLSR